MDYRDGFLEKEVPLYRYTGAFSYVTATLQNERRLSQRGVDVHLSISSSWTTRLGPVPTPKRAGFTTDLLPPRSLPCFFYRCGAIS